MNPQALWCRKPLFLILGLIGSIVLLAALAFLYYVQPSISKNIAQTPPKAPSPLYWVWLDSDLTAVVQAGLPQDELLYFFNNPHTLIIDSGSSKNDAILTSLPNATVVERFDTEADLASAVTSNTVYPRVTYVGFDAAYWAWARRNITDQQTLNKSAQDAATVAHQHGLKFFYALPAIVAPSVTQNPSGDKFTDFLNENLSGQGSAVSDVLEIEAQELQNTTSSFQSFSSQAIEQARAGNSSVPVLLGLTTYYANGTTYSEQSLEDAYTATHSIADGYWINGVNTSGADKVVQFLGHLYSHSL